MEKVKIEEMIEKEANRIYTNLKSKCKTYGELKKEISTCLKQEKWSGSSAGKIVLEKVVKKYEEEVSEIEMLPVKGSGN